MNKFVDPLVTASGAARAVVPFTGLQTLWINTGTLCNISCDNCYIESSPRNDRLAYISRASVKGFLEEAATHESAQEIGFTGGEPFMNPEFLGMVEDAVHEGFRVLILTNAMRPMQRLEEPLTDLLKRHGNCITFRVSLDHYTEDNHDKIRGPKSWHMTMAGLRWLQSVNANVAIAGRLMWQEDETQMRKAYQRLFDTLKLDVDASDPSSLVLFPEMDESVDVPEITEHCWGILDKTPDSVMCASARMVVQRKNDSKAKVVACTLIPYDPQFEMGETLQESFRPVLLNHKHCSKFCVLGGASCSQ